MLRKSEPTTVDMCAFDVYALHEYVDSSLPSTFLRSDENFTSSHTAIWYLSVCDEDLTAKTWSSPCHDDHSCDTAIDFLNNTISMIFQALQGQGVCLKELRSSLNVQGNADTAGIGVSRVTPSQLQQHLKSAQVMTSFCIEAFLVIAFLTASAVTHLRSKRAPRNRGETFLDALRAVLPTFFWSSVLLSLGIIVASIKARDDASGGLQTNPGQAHQWESDQLESWREGESIYSPYDRHLAAMASFLSALPPMMAGIMLLQSSRRRRLLIALIPASLAILLIPCAIMPIGWNYDFDRTAAGRVINFRFSDTLALNLYAMIAFASLALLTAVVPIAWLSVHRKSGTAQMPSRPSTCTVIFTGLVQFFLLATMIGELILLFFIRAKIIDAGDSSQLEWSFGQVLALTTWIPVAVEFVYTICGKFHIPDLIQLDYRD